MDWGVEARADVVVQVIGLGWNIVGDKCYRTVTVEERFQAWSEKLNLLIQSLPCSFLIVPQTHAMSCKYTEGRL
jgi:hypothetical protein